MADSEQTNQQNTSPSIAKVTFKKRCRFVKGNIPSFRQKRPKEEENSNSDSSSASSDDETTVVRRKEADRLNPLVQSTSSFKRARNIFDQDISKSKNQLDDEDDNTIDFRYKSKRTAESELPSDMGATATLETETERDRDAQAIFERAQKINEEIEESQIKNDDNDELKDHYQGLNNYRKYIKKKDTALGNASSGLVRQGPVRAPENIRSTIRWDYQPDICKDYKETGFCGFGDSCKFLHDRSDYKHGWQIELEVQRGTYDQQDEDYEIKDEDEVPFKCLMCRNSFCEPVVTKCKHYFCMRCALDHFRKSKKCYVCDLPTQGIFNPAKNIKNRLKNQEDDK